MNGRSCRMGRQVEFFLKKERKIEGLTTGAEEKTLRFLFHRISLVLSILLHQRFADKEAVALSLSGRQRRRNRWRMKNIRRGNLRI